MEDLKIFFEVSTWSSKFQLKVSFLNFEVSDQSFEVRGTHEPFLTVNIKGFPPFLGKFEGP